MHKKRKTQIGLRKNLSAIGSSNAAPVLRAGLANYVAK